MNFNPVIGKPIEFQDIEEPAVVVAIIANNVEKHIFCEASTNALSYLDNLKNSL